mmetsp:Transcript_103656/g.309621  ORF Transcript_103656/g.309621 Transcript_103656/m.309621 type:complete len:300 (-) Transcript_103656:49-948(-)
MKAHCRPGSQVVFRKRSRICPYLENSDLSAWSVMVSGSEPTKTFLGPSLTAGTAYWPSEVAGNMPGFFGSIGSLPNMPWCLAMVTSQGRSEPGKVSTLLQLFLANWACSGVAKVTNAHWRPGSQVVLMKMSTTCPYLANSSRSTGSETVSGKEPTKIFLGAICISETPPSVYSPPPCGGALWYVVSTMLDTRGSCPNIPWCLARVTSHGFALPWNCSTPFVIATALAAWSGVEKVTKAHRRPAGSTLNFRKTSSTVPYLENSSRSTASVTPGGSEPTKIFLAGVPLAVGMATTRPRVSV